MVMLLLLLLGMVLPGAGLQRSKSIDGIITPSDTTTTSPLRHPRRLRFALVDVALQLSHVSSTMDYAALGHLETACQVFLHQGLIVDHHPHTNITDIRVTVTSQTLGKSIYEQEADEALLPTYFHDSATNSYTIITEQEIALEYEIAMEDPILANMENRIKKIFSTQSEFLIDLLVVLEESYFDNVTSIQLFDTAHEEGSSSYFDQFDNNHYGHGIDDNAAVSSNAPPTDSSTSLWGKYGLIAVFVVAGFAVLISVLTLYPLLRRKCCRKPTEANRSVSTGRGSTGKGTVSVASNEIYDDYAKGLAMLTSDEEEEIEEPARKSEDQPKEVNTTQEEELSAASSELPSVSGIQAIYSDDKITSPMMLHSLRAMRDRAVGKVQSKFSPYRSDESCGGDLASIADSCPDTSRQEGFRAPPPHATLLKTPSKTEEEPKKRDIENQIERLRKQRRAIEQRIKAKRARTK
ncbi:MAG: hypothetical protein SGARI_001216 [Bacillariaceae sp.]